MLSSSQKLRLYRNWTVASVIRRAKMRNLLIGSLLRTFFPVIIEFTRGFGDKYTKNYLYSFGGFLPMLFNSIEFLIFLPIVFLLYWFVFYKTLNVQNTLLLAASYFFYGWW